MSVTFWPTEGTVEAPYYYVDHAAHEGIYVSYNTTPSLNVANGNFGTALKTLGLHDQCPEGDLAGSFTLEQMRQSREHLLNVSAESPYAEPLLQLVLHCIHHRCELYYG